MKTTRKKAMVGRRESGATPSPEGEAKRARQPGGSAAPDLRDASRNSAFRSPVDSGPPPIVRALRVEIAKPLDGTWRELEDLLRLYRSVMHQLYNAAIFGVAAEEEWGEKVFRLPGKAESSGGRAYQMIKREIDVLREWGAKQKGDGVATRYRDLNPSGAMMSAISREAMVRYGKWKRSKCSESLPSYRKGAPIPIRADTYSLSEENGRVTMSFNVEGKDGCGAVRVAIRASKGSHWSRLVELARADPAFKLGEAKIVLDERSNPKKWMVLISYSHAPPPVPDLDPENVMVVHRGQFNLLTAASNRLHFTTIARGDKYRSQRRALAARGTSAKRISAAERGNGAKGHGRERRYATYDAIQDTIARVNKTTCQQLGAAVVRLAYAWGCGRVVIEDYGGIDNRNESRAVRRFVDRFPSYQLKESVKWALRKDGLGLDEVPAAYISNECPRCCNVEVGQSGRSEDAKQWDGDVRRERIFRCRACGYERPSDFVAAIHMLRRSGADMSAWDDRFERERALAVASTEVVRADHQQETGSAEEPERKPKRTARRATRKSANPCSPRRVGVET